jgi:hypothetical protein
MGGDMSDYILGRSMQYSILSVVMGTAFMFMLITPMMAQPSSAKTERYCNEQYAYCAVLPSLGKIEPHEDNAPNHGVSVALDEDGSEAWIYAHWDAALLDSSPKVVSDEVGILLDKYPKAEVQIKPSMLAGMAGYRSIVRYVDNGPRVEQLVIAYRKPEDESKGPGKIYESGLKCKQDECQKYAKTLDDLIGTFQIKS